MKEFLTIGTVVLLKGAKHELMIIGFFPQIEVEGKKKVYDYLACYYPEGLVDTTKNIVFNREEIEKVTYSPTYSDEDNKKFLDSLSKIEDKVKGEE